MVISLEAREGEPLRQRRRQRRQLVCDQLVGERVRLGRHAHGQVVALGKEHLGQQVGDGFADARARLDRAVRGCGERRGDLGGHRDLLGTGLVGGVHVRDDPAGREGLLNLRRVHGQKIVRLGGIPVGTARHLAEQGGAGLLEVEGRLGLPHLESQVADDRAEGPVDVLVQACEVAQQTRR